MNRNIDLFEKSKANIGVKDLRRLSGMSQSIFAECTGIPLTTLQKWEIDNRTPKEYWLRYLRFYLVSIGVVSELALDVKLYEKDLPDNIWEVYLVSTELQKTGGNIEYFIVRLKAVIELLNTNEIKDKIKACNRRLIEAIDFM